MKEFISLIRSRSGERGIFNREGTKNFIYRQKKRSQDYDYGFNPCIVRWYFNCYGRWQGKCINKTIGRRRIRCSGILS